MNYSIIIPAHNEASNIERNVDRFLSELPLVVKKVLLEIIIVENGSTDETLAAAKRLAVRYPDTIRILSLARGSYGEAIKQGIIAACGSHLSILECDFLDSGFVVSSIERFTTNGTPPLIIASKRHPLSIDRRPVKRRILTFIFNLILRLTIGYTGTDTHGLKSLETKLAQRLCHAAITTDEVFQTEIVMLAWRWGVPIEEFPIRIEELRPTPVSVRRRLLMVLQTIGKLRQSLSRFPQPQK